MRQNQTLGIIIALLVMVALGAGAYLYITNTDSSGGGDNTVVNQPTSIPPPPVRLLEAVNDIPANRLIRQSDFSDLFQTIEVDPNQVTPDDIRENEFSTKVVGKVTTTEIGGGDRIKRTLFRDAGITEQIPTPVPGQSARKAMTVYITDLGNIVSPNNTVDIVASYTIDTKYLRFVGVEQQDQGPVIQLVDESYNDVTTKVLAQDVPVLKVYPPVVIGPNGVPVTSVAEPTPLPAEGTDTGTDTSGGVTTEPQPTPETTPLQGSVWPVVLAVTDQEAELIDYTRTKFGTLSLIVRRSDDREQVTTTGVTMDLLMRLYGVAQPYPQPNILVDLVKAPTVPQPPNQPPVVIPFPLTFGSGAPVPLPTAEPTPSP